MENGQRTRSNRAPRARARRSPVIAANDCRVSREHIADAELAHLLDEIWTLQSSDPTRVKSLCLQAIDRADAHGDDGGRFWAHITRALLAPGSTSRDTQDDIDAARTCARRVEGPRATRLLAIAEAQLLLTTGAFRHAFDRYSAMPLGSGEGSDDADDFFVLSGLASCASRLHELDALFNALYANLLLTERTGPPVRHAIAATDLAHALCAVGHSSEALGLIEGKVLTAATRWNNPLLLGRIQIGAAVARLVEGRAMEAHNDLLGLLADGVASVAPELAFELHSNLAAVCIQRGLLDEASRSVEPARAAARTMQRSAPLGVCQVAAGVIAHSQGQDDTAIDLLEEGLACFEQDLPFNAPMHLRADAGALLSRLHAQQGRHDKAYSSHRRFFHVQRQRTDHIHRGQIAALQAQQGVAASIRLTERELECLSWSAAGKTAWETGKILDLSEWTVVYHLEKAKRKFGLNRKQEVIAHAISLGLIKPHRAAES